MLDHTGARASSGLVLEPKQGTQLNSFGLIIGNAYRLRVPATPMLLASDAADVFTMGRDTRSIVLPVRRRVADVTLVVHSKQAQDASWAAKLQLPALFDVLVTHKALGCVVSQFLVEGATGHRHRRPLDKSQLFVGETYSVLIGCSLRSQVEAAEAAIGKVLDARAIRFPGASTADPVESAWSIRAAFDVDLTKGNAQLLLGLAEAMLQV